MGRLVHTSLGWLVVPHSTCPSLSPSPPKTERTSTKSENSPPKIGKHGYEIGTSNEFRLAHRQPYLITKGPFDVDIEEENLRRKFEAYLREHDVDDDTIMILRRHGVESLFDLLDDNASWWNELSAVGKQQLQHVMDLNNDYADVHWKRSSKFDDIKQRRHGKDLRKDLRSKYS